MQTPPGGRRGRRFSVVLVALSATLAAAALGTGPAPAGGLSTAASASQHAPLRVGDRGQRVRDLQWLLSGHQPSVYRRTIHPYHGRVDGVYGPRTAAAVKATKYRLGFPMREVDGRAGKQLFEFLLGKRARPLGWIGVASKRVHASIAGQTACSRRITAAARAELGVHESPWGSNDGARVRVYQSVTGAYHAPWCASFVQYVLRKAGVGTIANRSAGVFYIANWAHRHTLLHAQPKPGSVVLYLRALGHTGVVESVTKRGFYTIEGNASDAVRRRWHPTGYAHTVFIWLPHCAGSAPTARRLASVRASKSALAVGGFSVPDVFNRKSIWYTDVASTGGVRVDRLQSVPGGPIDVVYLNPRDPRATRTLRDQLVAKGESVGIFSDPHWYRLSSDPIGYRKQLDSDISRILGGAHDPVMLDFEQLPKTWVQNFLWGTAGTIGYRGANGTHTGGTRPTRDTAYTNEPFQDGSVVPIPDLIDANLAWFVQLYYGDMRPAEPWWALRQLVLWGYPASGLRPFYDAANYPPDWHAGAAGALFDSNRLAWLFQ
jgi:hypothetical protein